MTSPLTSNQSYYDEFAAGYETERHDGYHVLIDQLEADLITRYAKGGSVLEAGCGTGLVLAQVSKQAKASVGMDLSRNMLEKARARSLQVAHADITRIPFADATFDAAYSVKVLAHVERIQDALAEMARVVKPGGYVIAEFYNRMSLRTLIKKLKRPTPISDTNHDHAVYTRYDSLAQIRSYLPPSLSVKTIRGVRIVTPLARVHRIPVLGAIFRRLEWWLADLPGFRRLGGFMMVVCHKQESTSA